MRILLWPEPGGGGDFSPIYWAVTNDDVYVWVPLGHWLLWEDWIRGTQLDPIDL